MIGEQILFGGLMRDAVSCWGVVRNGGGYHDWGMGNETWRDVLMKRISRACVACLET